MVESHLSCISFHSEGLCANRPTIKKVILQKAESFSVYIFPPIAITHRASYHAQAININVRLTAEKKEQQQSSNNQDRNNRDV